MLSPHFSQRYRKSSLGQSALLLRQRPWTLLGKLGSIQPTPLCDVAVWVWWACKAYPLGCNREIFTVVCLIQAERPDAWRWPRDLLHTPQARSSLDLNALVT